MTARPPQPDNRQQERIRSIKERIRDGEYRVPADTVADAVINWYRRLDPPRPR